MAHLLLMFVYHSAWTRTWCCSTFTQANIQTKEHTRTCTRAARGRHYLRLLQGRPLSGAPPTPISDPAAAAAAAAQLSRLRAVGVWPGRAAPAGSGRGGHCAEGARGAAAVPHEARVLHTLARLRPLPAQRLRPTASTLTCADV